MSTVRDSLDEYVSEFNGDILPAYISLAALIGWVGFITIWMFSENGGSVAAAERVATVTEIWMVVLVAFPLASPALKIFGRRWREG